MKTRMKLIVPEEHEFLAKLVKGIPDGGRKVILDLDLGKFEIRKL
jgi:hypothetical protein